MNGNLYLVATPIGNLEDITFRALRILKEVDLIAAEDTRQSLKLLNHFEIFKPLISLHRHNEDDKSNSLIEELKSGKNIAIVTDAGTPGISDPGEIMVKEAIKNGINVIPIPGACALINGLIASGLNTDRFVFYGFLSLDKKLRKDQFDDIKRQDKTIILYEAPHKLIKTLNDIYDNFGDIEICLAKELTKIHETFIRDNIKNILESNFEPKGEFIIIFEVHSMLESKKEILDLNKLSYEEQYEYYKNQNMDKKEIIKKIAKNNNLSKNEIYQIFLDK